MKSVEIRQRFLDYFARQGHAVVPSASLVPDDPTLLFTNAGMVQFKDVFLGLEGRSYRRAASSQKCMRVTGKHNDLENVGPSPRHHTFFEMLGNFSFGDYFKDEAIRFGWEFVTAEMEIDPQRLVLTVHRDDEDALGAWTRGVGVAAERVLSMGDKTNFWMMADVGPCGPTSEIHYDFGPEHCTCGRADCSVALDNDCGRWLELWNLVFMQYDQLPDGTRKPLPKPGVDTGMGLERLAAILQGVYSNYQTDLFTPILDHVQRVLGHGEAERREHQTAYRVLGDHGRTMTFLVADGVLPGNDGRNYVLRLIMRRAMRFGRLIGLEPPFLPGVVDAVVETMAPAYPELVQRAGWIREVVSEEEARFERTLESGMSILDGLIAGLVAEGRDRIDGADVFRLYDTYGFPPDLTRAVAEEHGMTIDRAGFDEAMAAQRERARAGAGFDAGSDAELYRGLALGETAFVGYDALSATATVRAIAVEGRSVPRAGTSTMVEVVLDRTPFYAEAGGQVGDTGMLESPDTTVRILDTQAPVAGVVVHRGVVESGELVVGREVLAEVDEGRRLDIMRNHTATHLLHRSLERVLGSHAEQRGSLVAPDRLRFDFSHLKALTDDEVRQIERSVNEMVRADEPVRWASLAIDEARREGAKMLFGEKYGDVVRMVTVEGLSKELCGGTHLSRTGQIGAFVIRSEGSIGAGLRRIEALTGRGAEAFTRERLDQLQSVADRLGTHEADGILERLEGLLARQRELERALEAQRAQTARQQASAMSGDVVDVDGVAVVARRVSADDTGALRLQVDAVRDAVAADVIVLGAAIDGRPRLVVAASDAAVARGVHAGNLVKEMAAALGGGGGGRPTMAEAGGRDTEALDGVLASAPERVRAALAGGGR